ncbi:MAG: polysaccharide pyruvyl transferase family protein [Eubacteriales bacterium]|nr:polysaccharide pyruvyl transferase family protein [Eubacteriales bacterium]
MINLYYHGGSANHGCEAIVRSTAKILNAPMRLFTTSPEEDIRYGVDQVAEVVEDKEQRLNKKNFAFFHSAVSHKLTGTDYQYIKYAHKEFLKQISSTDICMSIGGDNYCYSGVDKLGYYNKMIQKKGAKTVLWGCSIEPSVLTKTVIEDLKRYNLITVRETLSYEGLKNAGIVDNVLLCSDPAFQLDRADADLPEGFDKSNTIGINVSPLVTSCGKLVMENYIELIKYILEQSANKILFIPHVVKPETNDKESLNILMEQFRDDSRVAMIEDCNCMELKGIISKCKLFVGARTHATIAAYSTCVPTLVVGYSIKSRGIARDIFGTEDNYVVSAQNFKDKNELKNAFQWLERHEKQIREFLEKKMPEYCQKSMIAGEAVKKLGGIR